MILSYDILTTAELTEQNLLSVPRDIDVISIFDESNKSLVPYVVIQESYIS